MEIVEHLDTFKKPTSSVVTIGTFDGVHIGHKEIIKRIVDQAYCTDSKSILVTFWPHPRFIIKSPEALKLITTFEEKCQKLAELGIDYLIKLPFTKEMASLSAETFLSDILINKIGTKELFIGYDHRFGNNREGDLQFLKDKSSKYGFEVFEIARKDIDDIGVSSTKIRNAVLSGDVKLANSLLGHDFSLSGRVVDGNKKGRLIGFPTANLQVVETYKIIPKDGVYAITVVMLNGKRFKGMLNIGFKPTVDGSERSIEAHIFEFEEDIYGENITVYFKAYIRDEKKFEDLHQLKNQLKADKEKILEILA